MQPRILLRTHYQADEPSLIIAGITKCCTPTESRDEEAVAAALKRWGDKNQYTISIPAAMYAIDNARRLGFLTKANRWSASGLALAFLQKLTGREPARELAPLEERLYLYAYLRGGGALVVAFAKWLLKVGTTTGEQLRKEAVIERLIAEALDEYLTLAVEVRDRTELRNERDRLRTLRYASSTKRHKRYPLLRTMHRLQLLDMDEGNELNVIRPDTSGRLAALFKVIPTVAELERLIREDILHRRLDCEMREASRVDLPNVGGPNTILLSAYDFAMQKGLQACPLQFLDEALIATFPSTASKASPQAEQILEPIHKQHPGEVRFHVDRRGKRAFVLIGAEALRSLTTAEKGLTRTT